MLLEKINLAAAFFVEKYYSEKKNIIIDFCLFYDIIENKGTNCIVSSSEPDFHRYSKKKRGSSPSVPTVIGLFRSSDCITRAKIGAKEVIFFKKKL